MWTSLLALGLAGCAGDKAVDDSGDPPVPGETVYLTDAHNYRYSGLIDAPNIPTQAGVDVTFDWSGLAKDIQCHDTDPVADIDSASVVAFRDLTEEEVELGFSEDDLLQVYMSLYIFTEPGDATSARLNDMRFFGTDIGVLDYYTEGSGTWLMIITTGNTPGVGGRALSFFTPVTAETNQTVEVGDACDTLDFDADLSALQRLPVSTEGPWPIDWSGLTLNGRGSPIDLNKTDSVMIARYDDLSAEDLQAQFLDLELLADGLWTVPIEGGTSLDLSAATDDAGAAFPGFALGSTWVLALRCGTCPNPAPVFLTVLTPMAP